MMDKRRQREQRERRPSPPVDKYGRHKDLRYSRMAKEPVQSKPKRPDEWHDPWRRSTTPKKKLGSKSPHRRRRSLSSSSASYSGSSRSSSYSSSSRSSSGSSYSSSYSRSSSGSRSPSPRRRRRASGPRSSKHPLMGSIRTPVARTMTTLGSNVAKPVPHTRKLMHLKPPLDSAIKKVSPDVSKQADRGRQLARPSAKDRTGPMPMVSARADLSKLRPGRPLVSERHKLLEKPTGNRNPQLPPDIDGVPMDESLPQAFARNKPAPKTPSKPTPANRQPRRRSLSYSSSSSSSRSRSRSRSRYRSSRSRSRSSSSSSSVSSRSSRSAENRGNKKPEGKNVGKVKSTVNTNLGTGPNVKKPFALSHKPIKLTLLNKPAEARPQPRLEKSIFETLKTDKPAQPERERSRSAKQDTLPKTGDKLSSQAPAAKGTAAKSSTSGSSSSRKRAASPQAPAKPMSKTTLPSQKSQAAAAAAKKTSMSRREELLKQLKAVEEAIAKKRAKLA